MHKNSVFFKDADGGTGGGADGFFQIKTAQINKSGGVAGNQRSSSCSS